MNKRLLTILLFALAISAVTSYVVYRMVGKQVAGRAGTAEVTTIVVAAKDLPLGAVITAADVKNGSWSGVLPKGVALKPESLIGRGVISALYEGEPILENRLATPGSGGGLAATIPPGMRAAAVRVDEVVGVAGFVIPGMRVDVLISGNPPGADASAGSQVKTLLQNIQVLSAGTNIQKDNEGKPVQVPVVNLLVTPDQAERLSLASNQTKIQLVLRNPLDTEVTKTSGSGMASLFAGAAPPPRLNNERPRVAAKAPAAVPPAPPVTVVKPVAPVFYFIEVMNGDKHTQAKFNAEEKR